MVTDHHQAPRRTARPSNQGYAPQASRGAAMARKTGQGANRYNCAEAAVAAPCTCRNGSRCNKWSWSGISPCARQPLAQINIIAVSQPVTCSGTSMYRHVLWHHNVAIRLLGSAPRTKQAPSCIQPQAPCVLIIAVQIQHVAQVLKPNPFTDRTGASAKQHGYISTCPMP